jgi:MFS family permease
LYSYHAMLVFVGIFGPYMGRFVDSVGRKAGSLLYTILYTIGALSTRSNRLLTLFIGRLAGGLGTSLLFSAPEAWLVAEYSKLANQTPSLGDSHLSQTFGWAYAGDSVVAIIAGQLASFAVQHGTPSAPFSVSVGFLFAAALLVLTRWTENVAQRAGNEKERLPQAASLRGALQVMWRDGRIVSLGAVQALFEGAMLIFVLQWPPAMKAAILSRYTAPAGLVIPFGSIFSCFMASCLVGSTLFSALMKYRAARPESIATVMLATASLALATSARYGLQHLSLLTAAFFAFEACVGMYFPLIGTLRARYLPDSHRSVLMNLFGIPLNLIVVGVFMNMHRLGTRGALGCASAALAGAAGCMAMLARRSSCSAG